MDLASAIKTRHSVRRYEQRPVPRHMVDQVIAAGQSAVPLRPAIKVRWHVVWDGAAMAQQLEGHIGIYGMFTTAPHYIIAVSDEHPNYMENMGFRMEQLILTATTLGLGTCWIGGMFTENRLTRFVPDLAHGERIIALTPLGYPDTTEAAYIAQQLLRWGNDYLGTRKPLSETVSQYIWNIPWTGEDEALNDILEQTRLAPSWGNIQPWHFVVDDRWILATVDHTPQRGNLREGKPYYRLDGGIAMCHFHLAAQARGWSQQWHIPEEVEAKMLRDRYAIPGTHDILGIYAARR
jgi:nitroreductase